MRLCSVCVLFLFSEVYYWCTSMITMVTSMNTVVVLQRVDCTNRQCNATQETTTSESCQKCEDLEKCYNYVVSSSYHLRLYCMWQEQWPNQLMDWSWAPDLKMGPLPSSCFWARRFTVTVPLSTVVYLTSNPRSYYSRPQRSSLWGRE